MFFISAGCSYSQVPNTDVTWPAHLQKQLDLTDEQVIHAGVGAIGNSMISRRTIYHVTQALKTHKPEDLLVGILWSGCDRHNFILRETENIYNKSTKLSLPDSYEEFKIEKSGITQFRLFFNNPMPLASDEFIYHTVNTHWNDELTVTYYNNFVDPLGSLIQTCENILRTEWFLKNHGIKYFMAAYDFDTFFFAGVPNDKIQYGYNEKCPALQINSNQEYKAIEHPDVKYLYDMIDKDYWLPIVDLGHWVKNVSKFDYRDPTDPHPSTEQHIDFTNKIILPFLEQKYGITKPKLP